MVSSQPPAAFLTPETSSVFFLVILTILIILLFQYYCYYYLLLLLSLISSIIVKNIRFIAIPMRGIMKLTITTVAMPIASTAISMIMQDDCQDVKLSIS